MTGQDSLNDLMKQLPVGDLAASLGISADATEGLLGKMVPGLLGGMAVNTATQSGADSLEHALKQHVRDEPILSVQEVDVADGEKIVANVFGDKTGDVVAALTSDTSGASSDLISKMLPMVAPMVMAYLASTVFGSGGNADTSTRKQTQTSAGGGIGDLLGGILSGGGSKSGGPLGDLGKILGGGSSGGSGGLGGLLGSILGGK